MKSQLFCLFALFSVAFAALASNGAVNIAAGATTNINLASTASSTNTLLVAADAAISTALSVATGAVPTVSVTSSNTASVSITIGADVNAGFSGQAVAGGNAPTVGLAGALTAVASASVALNVTISASASTQLTVNITLSQSLLASTSNSVNYALLIQSTDYQGNANAAVNFFGATQYSLSGNQYIFVIPANTPPQMYLVGLDSSQAASSAISAATNATNSAGASANFNAAAKFLPIAYNTNFNLVSGLQYAYGSNIQVAPIASATNQAAGQLQVQYNGNFGASGASSAPNTNGGAYFNGYYQFTGNGNANNVIQWTSNANSAFTTASGTAYTNAQASAAASFTNTVSWYKAITAQGSATASTNWQAVQSYKNTVAASGSASAKVSVWANVNTYSQWTIAANGTGTSSTTQPGAASVAQISFAAVFAALALVFAF